MSAAQVLKSQVEYLYVHQPSKTWLRKAGCTGEQEDQARATDQPQARPQICAAPAACKAVANRMRQRCNARRDAHTTNPSPTRQRSTGNCAQLDSKCCAPPGTSGSTCWQKNCSSGKRPAHEGAQGGAVQRLPRKRSVMARSHWAESARRCGKCRQPSG
jgi:hypothetical protein